MGKVLAFLYHATQFFFRIATLSASVLTMLMWIYYNCDITAEMTSGPPPLPINNFDDVLHYGYKVIVDIPFHKGLLADGAPGKQASNMYRELLNRACMVCFCYS